MAFSDRPTGLCAGRACSRGLHGSRIQICGRDVLESGCCVRAREAVAVVASLVQLYTRGCKRRRARRPHRARQNNAATCLFMFAQFFRGGCTVRRITRPHFRHSRAGSGDVWGRVGCSGGRLQPRRWVQVSGRVSWRMRGGQRWQCADVATL